MSEKNYQFKISSPSFTQIPNILLDEWLPMLKEIELKVLLTIYRKTFGYHKQKDQISLSQLVQATGSTRTNVFLAIEQLVSKNIIRKKVIGTLGSQKTFYEVVLGDEKASPKSRPETSPKLIPPPSPKLGLTKENMLNKEKENNKRDCADVHKFLQLKERVSLTEKQSQELQKQFSSEDFELIIDKLNDWKIKNNQTYKSDYQAIKRWVIEAVNNEKNKTEAKETGAVATKEKNLTVIKEIISHLERTAARGDPKIIGNEFHDILLNKSISLSSERLPKIISGWYNLEWKDKDAS